MRVLIQSVLFERCIPPAYISDTSTSTHTKFVQMVDAEKMNKHNKSNYLYTKKFSVRALTSF